MILRVNGATLHYEVRGQGPLLLLIPGGSGGAAAFDDVVDHLAAEHRVVTYDPRGMSRSTLDDPDAEQSVAEHADDAARLLDALAPGERAGVFGTSSGAIVALHLLTTRPEHLDRVIAHEPPVVEVLPDAAEYRALVTRVRDTFEADGLMPAMTVFAAGLRKPGDTTPQPQVELPPARVEQTMANLPFFVGRIVPSFMTYRPDLDRLRTLSSQLVLAGGQDSRGELPYRPAAQLAETFGTELVHFPGGHTGLTTHPTEFAEHLRLSLSTCRSGR
ncbi:alpha/beta fold hydrolase [Amycolatopsis sp. 195334CR]|uniref:alpha/beta fold hydrolase n=1 Tax=Amycolatopsis sp. 195334CR TaxID=2814588 RepID=UPI001A8C0624|nr:alpha/beta hydrolase [Amycolatopsis sp. 195334CR]MBN6039916.1 alpha/beta hydrolase [Amycolatopsis sp. 195334CR]